MMSGKAALPSKNQPAPYRILVVDDEPLMREMLLLIFQRHHLVADGSVNGRDALRLLGRNKYDLDISDLHMPEMDGIALLCWIRENQPEIDVILMTGDSRYKSEAITPGRQISGFLNKPFSMNQMLTAVAQCRQRKL